MGAAPAIELAPGVWRVPTAPKDLVNSYVFVDQDGQVTLVDCGLKRAPRKILAALSHIGSGAVDVTRIIATHAHPDHVGGLAAMRNRTHATVAVHRDEAPFVRAGRGLPVRRDSLIGRFLRSMPRHGAAPVDLELQDGDVLPVAGSLRVVGTPGHSPGHVSLLHEPSGVLITGDALFNWTRRISWPPSMLCIDVPMTRRTAHVLGELDYTTAAFTHGPPIATNARAAVRGFLQRSGGGR